VEAHLKVTTVTAIALLWATGSWAADDIKPLDVKPGLWESKVSTETGGMPKRANMPAIPPETLAKMPPAQRAQVEAMMKSRAGGGPMVTTNKVCITKESLSNGRAFSRDQKSCTSKVVSSTGVRQQIHIDCNQDEVKMSGDLTVERVDSNHIKGNMVMKGGQPQHPVDMKMSFENTWISSDCGDVKPPAAK
jgi:hypothetical protein